MFALWVAWRKKTHTAEVKVCERTCQHWLTFVSMKNKKKGKGKFAINSEATYQHRTPVGKIKAEERKTDLPAQSSYTTGIPPSPAWKIWKSGMSETPRVPAGGESIGSLPSGSLTGSRSNARRHGRVTARWQLIHWPHAADYRLGAGASTLCLTRHWARPFVFQKAAGSEARTERIARGRSSKSHSSFVACEALPGSSLIKPDRRSADWCRHLTRQTEKYMFDSGSLSF